MTYSAVLPFLAVVAIWLIHLLDRGLVLDLNRWGIAPREWSGLIGVVLAPLLHGDLEHLIGNSVPPRMIQLLAENNVQRELMVAAE